jgi:GTPase SAR1 family protein
MTDSHKLSGGASTIGVEYHPYIGHIDDHEIEIDLWDTSGQDRFRTLGKIHYKHSNGIILVYDVTNGKSLAALEKIWLEGTT